MVPSPNIWHHTATYEIENRAFDRDGLVEDAMRAIAPWRDRTVLDLGCGTGFHLPRWAEEATQVVGVEPHSDLLALARRRSKRLPTVTTRRGTAQATGLPDASVDVVHARWAYFFGPGCEPGLAELDRVIRRGGTAYVIDNDPTTSTFGGWFRRGYPYVMPERVESFWSQHGWTRTPILTSWQFESRADLEAVVRIEFTRDVAEEIVASHVGTTVDYAVNLWHRTY
ncbi:class I SAM-dependent methyltransferase [Nocardioides sp. Bht2]|uniref:class I SAM-dependent methyltransferase n=1 Tax=Nocardioides sp. Bht2 TaxID=3392297 RepID=UPI0039B3AB61